MTPVRAVGLLVAALAACACGDPAARILETAGLRTVSRVPAEEARAWVADGRARLVQRRDDADTLRPLPGATWLRDDEAPPGAWRAQDTRWLAVADDPEAAVALAARLRRAGLPRVGVVTGDPRALGDRRPVRAARAAQPPGQGGHPNDPGAAGGP